MMWVFFLGMVLYEFLFYFFFWGAMTRWRRSTFFEYLVGNPVSNSEVPGAFPNGEAITLFSNPPCCQQHMDPTAGASRHLCQNAVAWRNQAEKPRVHSVPLMQGCGYGYLLDIP